MGVKETKQPLPAHTLRRRLTTPRGKMLGECFLLLFSGVALAGVRIGEIFVPLAACLVLAVPFGLRTVAAAVGAIFGFLLRCDMVEAAESIALTVLLFSASAVFQGTQLSAKPWFWPLLAAGVCAAMGTISLMGGRHRLLPWALKWLAVGLVSDGYRNAMSGSRHGQILWLATAVMGMRGLATPIDLALLTSVAIGVFVRQPLTCVALGLALDLSGGAVYGMGLALFLPTVLFVRNRQKELLQALAFLVCTLLLPAVLGNFHAEVVIGVAVGTSAGVLLRHFFPIPHFAQDMPETETTETLETAADLMELLSRQLPPPGPANLGEAESVYDGAAEQICRCCGKFTRCWKQNTNLTLAALSDASKLILERGVAQSTDFPKSFRDACCHLEGFVTAINQELDGLLFRRRYRMELQESRQILAEEFFCVGEYLRTAAQPISGGRARFRVAVGACSVGKNGSRVSGDRGVCFAGKNQEYFIILCDGMGTGREAARCSSETVRFLERLLRSGVDAHSALRMLNGLELLRGTSDFTTIDLLMIDLERGEGTLYKWGSAPSFWKLQKEVKKIGTASPPPGVGVGGDHAPEQYRLSLNRGEMLVLASDGAVGAQTETRVCDYCGDSVHELAALLIADAPPEDDVSAVVVSLKPCG